MSFLIQYIECRILVVAIFAAVGACLVNQDAAAHRFIRYIYPAKFYYVYFIFTPDTLCSLTDGTLGVCTFFLYDVEGVLFISPFVNYLMGGGGKRWGVRIHTPPHKLLLYLILFVLAT